MGTPASTRTVGVFKHNANWKTGVPVAHVTQDCARVLVGRGICSRWHRKAIVLEPPDPKKDWLHCSAECDERFRDQLVTLNIIRRIVTEEYRDDYAEIHLN